LSAGLSKLRVVRDPTNAPVMKGRFVLVIKNRDTDEEVYKARYVVQGFLDPLKQRAVHNHQT
jgi:hypothetical protein